VSGIIQVEDIDMIAEEMERNTTAAVMLFENLWAIKFKEAVLRANGKLLAQVAHPLRGCGGNHGNICQGLEHNEGNYRLCPNFVRT